MKNTGIIRKIDKLGRIVIPKEIRNSLRILDDDNLELLIDGENIVLKKFSYIKNIKNIAQTLLNSIKYTNEYNVIIYDSNSVIATTHKYKFLIGSLPTFDMLKYIPIYNSINKYENIDIEQNKQEIYIKPIISNGTFIANIIVISDEKIDKEKSIINYISNFIGKYMEI